MYTDILCKAVCNPPDNRDALVPRKGLQIKGTLLTVPNLLCLWQTDIKEENNENQSKMDKLFLILHKIFLNMCQIKFRYSDFNPT
jgi:hypothetical protein